MPLQSDILPSQLLSALEQLVPIRMADKDIAGLSMAWVQPATDTGQAHVAWQRTFGHTNAITGDPITVDSAIGWLESL